MNGATVKVYSLAKDGEKNLSANFKVREFACKDGTDPVFISNGLVQVLQQIRAHFGRPVTINSSYRTVAHNKKPSVKGSPTSQHLYGMAADIVVKGVTPKAVASYAEELLRGTGGIGRYKNFTHVDVRAKRARWDNTSGRQIAVDGF